MTCDTCGQELRVGMFPWCPHAYVARGKGADVTWAGGRTFENLAHEPVTFYSPAEKASYLRSHHLEEAVRHVPVPGSDKSPHTTSWSGISQYSLDAATAMLERQRDARSEPETWIESMEVTVTDEAGAVWAEKGTFGAL